MKYLNTEEEGKIFVREEVIYKRADKALKN